jgi:hypothetical protein
MRVAFRGQVFEADVAALAARRNLERFARGEAREGTITR